MSRVYLYVPFEDREQVGRLGARWDQQAKCWYIEDSEEARFSKWLDTPVPPYSIASEEAYVASTSAQCWKCRASIEVLCVYCEGGLVQGERYGAFTVSDVTAIDDVLSAALKPWPFFKFASDKTRGGQRYLVNHCSACGVVQRDYFLHCEPGGRFFRVKGAETGAIKFTRVEGVVRLSGDEGFEP